MICSTVFKLRRSSSLDDGVDWHTSTYPSQDRGERGEGHSVRSVANLPSSAARTLHVHIDDARQQ